MKHGRVFAAALLVLAQAAAVAQPAPTLPLWELGIGVGGLSLPYYRGADRQNNWLLPVPYAVYRGEVLRADRNGVKALLFDSERMAFDVSLAATPPARSADVPVRAGMPDLAGTLEIGPTLNVALARGSGWRAELRLPLRAAFTLESSPRAIGWAATPHVNVDHRLGAWNLGVQAGALWGSRRLHGYFYDVAPAYASAARPAYQARAGSAGWQTTLALSRRDGKRWFGAFVRADTLAGSTLRESPLVQRRQHVSAGLAVSWVLWESSRQVPAPGSGGV
ncbi:MipA/OmpV family protein [Pseudorhodoferax sp.]|uniref:MipA/OmpV family protein n=1 Tax=Pseudorhodoferax sp. TaxID=1993553 RepID=UPI002DD6B653|nr:MipA/OmpV family protein [Pseudorhodoferax sp.]